MNKKLLSSICLLAVAGTIWLPRAAEALDPPAAADSNDIGEIIVTAQRKDESLSKTPVAVSVVSADALDKAQIVSERDLQSAVPGLSVNAGLNSNQLNYSLRGQSQDAYSGTRPGVLPYVDEIQIGGAGTSSAFYDLQSVQVLKGPQGTLFGRSATGGAVLFTTAKPTSDFEGYASATGGDYGLKKFELAISGPIIGDVLLGRLATTYQERDGFQYNVYDGQEEGGYIRKGARGSLTLDLGSFKNELVVDYFHSNSQSSVAVLSGLVPFTGGGPGNPPFIPLTLLYSGTSTPAATATGIALLQALTGAPAAAATAYYNAYFANPKHPASGLTSFLATQNARGPYVIDSPSDNIYDANNWIASDISTLDLGNDNKLRNIIGFTDLNSFLTGNAAGTPYALATTAPGNGESTSTEQLSEELQLQGSGLSNRASYTTGVYFSHERVDYQQDVSFFDLLFGGQSQLNAFVTSNTTYAGYAQGTYQLNDSGLASTLGVRYTSEKAEIQPRPFDVYRMALGDTAPPGYSYDQSTTYNRLSWQVGLQDQFSPNVLFYAVSRRAYKSGGFNGIVAPLVGYGNIGGDAYRPEEVTDVELGTKFQGSVAGMPARADIAIYNDWVLDSQRTAYTLSNGNPATVTVNVPNTRTYGLELDGQIKPSSWLNVGGSFNYTHPEFTNGEVIVNGAPSLFNQVPDTQEISGTFFSEVSHPLTANLLATLHADVYDQTKTYRATQSVNNAGTILPGYALVFMHLTIEDVKAGWSVTANVKNLLNRVYYGGALPTGEIAQYNTRTPGDPRTYTVEARYRFGSH